MPASAPLPPAAPAAATTPASPAPAVSAPRGPFALLNDEPVAEPGAGDVIAEFRTYQLRRLLRAPTRKPGAHLTSRGPEIERLVLRAAVGALPPPG